jgi:hypothetical protein
MGSGLPALESSIGTGDGVTEDQLKKLIGQGTHPVTGQLLGRRYRTFAPPEEGKRRHAVAGCDLTFSIPKSASVLWGVADAGTQAIIADAHHAAVADVIDFLEREVVATRVGAKGPKGAVAQVDVTGVIAAAFDHYDSRANDPHLHTHVVISNKVRTCRDGQRRTIDGAPLHTWAYKRGARRRHRRPQPGGNPDSALLGVGALRVESAEGSTVTIVDSRGATHVLNAELGSWLS